MSKKVSNLMYIDQDEMSEKTVEELLIKAIGRKRKGVVRIQYIHQQSVETDEIKPLASIVSYKFYREMESVSHMIGDRPDLDDLIGADLPWIGLVKARDEKLDERYKIDGYVRTLLDENNFIFMIRDIEDGSPYSDGLSLFNIIEKDNKISVSTQTGLSQTTVVSKFQGYFEALESLKNKLFNLGYKDNGETMTLIHNGEEVSTIDITLVGKRIPMSNK